MGDGTHLPAMVFQRALFVATFATGKTGALGYGRKGKTLESKQEQGGTAGCRHVFSSRHEIVIQVGI